MASHIISELIVHDLGTALLLSRRMVFTVEPGIYIEEEKWE
jgi:hypothetical protein